MNEAMLAKSGKLSVKLGESSGVIKTEVVCPNDTNPMGILQGGRLVQWMDIAAAVCAQTFAETICVTVSIDRVSFRHPVRVGDILTIEASLSKVARTSMQIRVRAWSAAIGKPIKYLVSEAEFVFVAIDEQGRPTPVQKKSNPKRGLRKLKKIYSKKRIGV